MLTSHASALLAGRVLVIPGGIHRLGGPEASRTARRNRCRATHGCAAHAAAAGEVQGGGKRAARARIISHPFFFSLSPMSAPPSIGAEETAEEAGAASHAAPRGRVLPFDDAIVSREAGDWAVAAGLLQAAGWLAQHHESETLQELLTVAWGRCALPSPMPPLSLVTLFELCVQQLGKDARAERGVVDRAAAVLAAAALAADVDGALGGSAAAAARVDDVWPCHDARALPTPPPPRPKLVPRTPARPPPGVVTWCMRAQATQRRTCESMRKLKTQSCRTSSGMGTTHTGCYSRRRSAPLCCALTREARRVIVFAHVF